MAVLTKTQLGFRWCRAISLGLLFLLLAGCDTGQQEKPGQERLVRLDKLQQLPVGQAEPDSQSLRIGVGAILSPQGTALSYQPLIDYLGRKLGKPAILVQRKTYQELNDLLARNVVDLGFICTGAYVEGARNGAISLLVVPQINGKTTYRAFVIVPAASPAREFSDLRGKVGRIDTRECPLYLLTGEYDFSCTPDDTRWTADRIPGARLTIMTEIGHFPMSENPGQFRKYLIPVLDEIRLPTR